MVGKICTVCRRSSYIDKHLSFFSYPGDQQRRHEWLKAVDRMYLLHKVDNYKTRGNHRICEVHFEEKYVRTTNSRVGRKFLTKDAFPTLCLGTPNVTEPMTSVELRPPSPVKYAQTTIWKEYQDLTNNKSISIKKENKIKTQRKFVKQEEMIHNNMVYKKPKKELNIKVRSPSSSPSYADISQFCESVMKVSKGTQTLVTESKRKKIDITPQVDIKDIAAIEATNDKQQLFMQMCSTFLPPNLLKIVKWNLSSSNCRQNINFMLFAINLHYISNLYKLLKDLVNLPTKESLKYFLLPKSTRLSETFINALRCKVKNMSTKEKVCSVSIGSILLKPNLYYDIKHDRVIGLHDVNGKQRTCVAKYAVMLMVQGILENWRQPIAYAFISEYDDSSEISAWIDEVLTTLIDVGLDVRAFVSDSRLEFLYTSESRSITPSKTCFTINGTGIFYTYDTTQLLKIVKYKLKSCDFDYGPNTKITSNHDFYKKINYLCNVLNAKSQFSNSPYKRAFANKKYQTDFLKEMLLLFQNLKVVRKSDGADVTHNMKFIKGFQIAINSTLQLFDELRFLGVECLITSRLNHNYLNRFLSKVKPLNSKEECTPRQFNKAFVRSFVFNMLKKPLGGSNVEDSFDSDEFTQEVLHEEVQETHLNYEQPLAIHTTDYRLGLPEKNAFVYVCGYCYLKCIQQHSCNTFSAYLRECKSKQEKANVYNCSVSLNFNASDCQTMPPDEFTQFLMGLETLFKEYLDSNVPITNLGHEMMEKVQKFEFSMPCPCFPIEYLKALFIRVRLYYTIRKNNKLLNRKKSVNIVRAFSL